MAKRIWTILFAVGVLGCAAPAAAAAAETIGTDIEPLAAASFLSDPEGNGERRVYSDQIEPSFLAPGGLTADEPGVITSFRIKYGSGLALDPQLALRVVRQIDSNTFFHGLSSDPVAAGVNGTVAYPTRLPIGAGEGIGIDLLPGMATQVVPFLHVPVAAGSRGRTGGAGAGDGPFPPNTEGDYPAVTNSIHLVNATVEPDADGDGFGDETQDACPTDAAAQGACPTTVPPTAVLPNPCSSIKKKKARKRCRCKQKESRKARKKCLRKLEEKSDKKKSDGKR